MQQPLTKELRSTDLLALSIRGGYQYGSSYSTFAGVVVLSLKIIFFWLQTAVQFFNILSINKDFQNKDILISKKTNTPRKEELESKLLIKNAQENMHP